MRISYEPFTLTPENAEFVLLCFEGPDLYSQAGGLGVRVSELSHALAKEGFRTHLVFVGDPNKPSREALYDGRLTVHRWSQWISRYYPSGVYQGETEKLYDYNETVPWHVLENIVRPAVAAGRMPVIMGEDWHTAHAIAYTSDLLWEHGLRHRTLLAWNANNPMGFDKINWGRLNYVATIMTVSRYMKHVMWGRGVNPIVIPNGIPDRLFADPPRQEAEELRKALNAELLFTKVGRWDPDKRWNMAVAAVGQLKSMGANPKFIVRGGIEPHEGEVLDNARRMGLSVAEIRVDEPTLPHLLRAMQSVDVDVYNLKFFVPQELSRILYHASDAVLANSGMEPFGLVGLEVMASGGVAFTGATGEDYAKAFENAIVLETDDPREIVAYVLRLQHRPEEAERIRAEARSSARRYMWPHVIRQLLYRLEFIGASAGLVQGRALEEVH